MSANMAMQEGRVQQEQSDMRLAVYMAKIAKGGLLRAAKEETQYQINNPYAKVREEKMWRVDFAGPEKVNAAIDGHPAMLRQIHTAGCHSCENGTSKNPQARCKRKGTGAPLHNRRRQQTLEPTPPLSGTSPASTGNTSTARSLKIGKFPPGYPDSQTFLSCADCFTLNTSAQNCDHDT
jgi:hypothetical protein